MADARALHIDDSPGMTSFGSRYKSFAIFRGGRRQGNRGTPYSFE
jgi:hypothetical protein